MKKIKILRGILGPDRDGDGTAVFYVASSKEEADQVAAEMGESYRGVEELVLDPHSAASLLRQAGYARYQVMFLPNGGETKVENWGLRARNVAHQPYLMSPGPRLDRGVGFILARSEEEAIEIAKEFLLNPSTKRGGIPEEFIES